MRKHRLVMIKKQGNRFDSYSFHIRRDSVTGELSVSFTRPGHAWVLCIERVIPELRTIAGPRGNYLFLPRESEN